MPTLNAPEKSGNYQVVWGPQRFRLSIGWKTLIAFALVVFLPMIGLTALSENALLKVVRQNAANALAVGLHSAQRAYSDRAATVSAVLAHTAAIPGTQEAMRTRDRSGLADLLQQHAAQLPFADSWLAIDAKGTVIARRNGSGGDYVTLNNVLSHVVRSREAVSSTEILPRDVFLRENQERYLRLDRAVMAQVVAVPVMNNREVAGVLAGLVLLNGYEWLPNLIHDGLSADPRLFGVIVQESRVIALAQRPGNFWSEGLLVPAEINDPVLKGRVFNGRAVINDATVFVRAEPILNFQKQPIGALAVGARADRVQSFVRDNLTNIYLFGAIGVLASLVIAYFAHRDTIRPIKALVGAMAEFAGGNLNVRTRLSTKDEFDDLGRGFNQMADAIQDQQERVEKYNSLAKVLITTLNPRELLKNALDKVLELTRSELGAIYLFDASGEYLEPFVTYGVDAQSLPPLKNGDGIPGHAAMERRTMVLEYIPENSYIRINTGLAYALPREVAAFPLIYKEKVLGVMLLGTFDRYRADELPLVEYLTNQIAITLDNALTHEKVERLSITDGLTGLFNRRHLSERMEQEFSKAVRYGLNLSLLVLDVDHFKKINDVFGHQVGDNALIAVAQTLRRSVRESDVAGRYGGEEFVVLLPHAGPDQARAVAEKIRLAVAGVRVEGIGDKGLTISIGVASYPAIKARNLHELVRGADAALYQAKEEGRDRVVMAGEAAIG
ncbi:MAG: diguanylate cyclase [Pseudomonadota bacterium]